MKKGFASLAIVGTIAAVAVFSENFLPKSANMNSQVLQAEDMQFMKFVSKYGKSYGTKSELEFRQEQFKANLAQIAEDNSSNGNTYTLGINKFADYTHEEFKALLGYKKSPLVLRDRQTKNLSTDNLPASVDWRQKGALNPVKDQGHCGSCWAFSTIGVLESRHFIQTGELLSLSEQQLVDCAGKYNPVNQGCDGGEMYAAFDYAKTDALELETNYPYKAVDQTCTSDAVKGKVFVTESYDVPPGDADQLRAAIAQGPVSIALRAEDRVFQFYQSGVLNSKKCLTELDHGVVAVGYGEEGGVPYFLIRNSWGAGWGDNGHIKVAALPGTDGKGICGMLQDNTWALTD